MQGPVSRSAMLVTILIVSASALLGQRIVVTSDLGGRAETRGR